MSQYANMMEIFRKNNQVIKKYVDSKGVQTTEEKGETFNHPDNEAKGEYSHAEGRKTAAIGDASHAEGTNIPNNDENEYVHEYKYIDGQGVEQTIEIHGPRAEGKGSHAEGSNTYALGHSAHAEGCATEAIGGRSHAEGTETKAIGPRSHAEGGYTITEGIDSHAEGSCGQAVGRSAHVEGFHSGYNAEVVSYYDAETDGTTKDEIAANHNTKHYHLAYGRASHVEGVSNLSYGEGSHAEGKYNQALADRSHAEGYKTIASGNQSHAEGNANTASGDSAHAEGTSSVASGNYSHAEGGITEASGQYSHAEGWHTIAASSSQHVQGRYNIADRSTNPAAKGKYAHIVGGGDKEDELDEEGNIITQNRKNIHTLDWTGNGWFAGKVTVGVDNKALITEDDIEGTYATITYVDDKAKNHYVVAGRKADTTAGERTTAEGKDTTSSGYSAHAEGVNTVAEGQASHAEGDTISRSSVGGTRLAPIAYGRASHAEGTGTIAGVSGNVDICASHAEGVGSQAIETGAHAEGFDTSAQGKASHAEGVGTVAVGLAQHVEGEYNKADTIDSKTKKGKYIHIAGNGSSSNPSNAHTLDWNGNAWYAGNVYAGALKDGTYDPDTKLVTAAAIDNSVVLYDKKQNLTPEQQERACSNIGALKANDDIDMADNDINNVSNIDVHNQINIGSSSNEQSLSLVPDGMRFNRLDDKGFVLMSGGYKHNEDTDTTCAVAEFYGLAGDEPTILSNIADGINEYDAVTKRQLDAAVAQLEKELENVPYKYLEGTEDQPIILRDLTNGIYYIKGYVQYYHGANIYQTSTGLFIVERSNNVSRLIRFAPESEMQRYYKIYDTKSETYPVDLAGITTALERISALEEALENKAEINPLSDYTKPTTTSRPPNYRDASNIVNPIFEHYNWSDNQIVHDNFSGKILWYLGFEDVDEQPNIVACYALYFSPNYNSFQWYPIFDNTANMPTITIGDKQYKVPNTVFYPLERWVTDSYLNTDGFYFIGGRYDDMHGWYLTNKTLEAQGKGYFTEDLGEYIVPGTTYELVDIQEVYEDE